MLVVNASNINKDFDWLNRFRPENVQLANISKQISQIALQGPKAQQTLQKLSEINLAEIKFFKFKQDVKLAGHRFLVSRTGYTGEDGFEIYGEGEAIKYLWKEILKAGEGVVFPVGLGARDTLRFEATLPLYGNEISSDISPIEAGLGSFVKFKKPDYIGKEILKQQKDNPLQNDCRV